MIFSVLFVISGIFCSQKIVKFLGADDSVFFMTNTYLKVLLLFSPAFLINNLLQCFVRNDKNPSLSMIAMITGCFCNVILDYIFIFPLDMGIFGAIFATGLSPVISIFVILPYLIKRKNGFNFAKTFLKSKYVCKILSCGIPPFLTEATSGIVMFLFNFIILKISGNTGVAAFGIISAISLVVIAIYTGLSQGIQPVISSNYGLKNSKNIKDILKFAIIFMMIISSLIYSIIYFGANNLALIFNGEKNSLLQNYAVKGLKLYFTVCPFVGFNIVISTYFISTEKSFFAQIISFLRGFVILIPAAFLLSFLFKMEGVWLSFPVTEIIVSLVAILLLKKSRCKKFTTDF